MRLEPSGRCPWNRMWKKILLVTGWEVDPKWRVEVRVPSGISSGFRAGRRDAQCRHADPGVSRAVMVGEVCEAWLGRFTSTWPGGVQWSTDRKEEPKGAWQPRPQRLQITSVWTHTTERLAFCKVIPVKGSKFNTKLMVAWAGQRLTKKEKREVL